MFYSNLGLTMDVKRSGPKRHTYLAIDAFKKWAIFSVKYSKFFKLVGISILTSASPDTRNEMPQFTCRTKSITKSYVTDTGPAQHLPTFTFHRWPQAIDSKELFYFFRF